MKRFLTTLLAPGFLAFVADANPAKAVLDYNIYESQGNLIVETSGFLNLPGSPGPIVLALGCNIQGVISPFLGKLCTGPDTVVTAYDLSGPLSFGGTANLFPATSVSGVTTILHGFFKHLLLNRIIYRILPSLAQLHSTEKA